MSWGHNGLLKLFEKEDMKIHKNVTDKVSVPEDPSWNVPRWLQEAMNVDSCCRAGSSRFRLSLWTFLFFFLSNKVHVFCDKDYVEKMASGRHGARGCVHAKCRGLFGVIMFV